MGTKQNVSPIGLLPQNLRSEEMVVQICDRLSLIQATSENLFTSIKHRVSEIRTAIEDLQRRTNDVKDKISQQARQEDDKAIQIFCPPRYMIGKKDMLVYKPLYPDYMFHQLSSRLNAASNKPKYKIQSQHIPFDDELINYKLEHIQPPYMDTGPPTSVSDFDKVPKYQRIENKHLSDFMPRITSVTSLLTFHTYENILLKQFGRYNEALGANSSLYDQSRVTRLKKAHASGGERSDTMEDSISRLGPPPESINNYDTFMETSNVSTLLAHFMPEEDNFDETMLNDDLPDMLPSLTGVVRDISKLPDQESVRTLTKSVSTASMSSHLINTQTNNSLTKLPKAEVTAPGEPPAKTRSESEIPVPPPLPSIEMLMGTMKLPPIPETKHMPNISSGYSSTIDSQQPPPPPPLPVPTSDSEPTTTTSKVVDQNVKIAIPSDGGRASLLESIRAAAGKPKKVPVNLRDKKLEAKKEKQQKETAVGGDLMSDLVNKLKMRRDGISGSLISQQSQQEQNQKASQVNLPEENIVKTVQQRTLEKVSSMIPAPTKPHFSSSDESDLSDNESWT